MRIRILAVIGALTLMAQTAFADQGSNPPWFPSLMAFEHYDSGRTHLFDQVNFHGSFAGDNMVNVRISPDDYPTPYNVVYLSAKKMFVYGGGFGDKGGTGAFVAQVNPKTLQIVWHTQLINTVETNEWNYPGVVSALHDGFLYLIYGYRLAKIDPKDGHVVGQVVLPTLAEPRDTSYNGLDGLRDGTLIAKTVYRQKGCVQDGFSAFLNCSDPTDVPNSLLVAINPKTLTIVDQVEVSEFTAGRVTTTRFKNTDYIYLAGSTQIYRYLYKDKHFTLDTSWGPVQYRDPASGQNTASALVVMNDWVVFSTNGGPATTGYSPWLSVIAINQADAAKHVVQPFKKYVSPPGYPISLGSASVSVDPVRNQIFALDAGPGMIGALELRPDGLHSIWTVPQRTTEFLLLIGPWHRRVLVTTAIPDTQSLATHSEDQVVWREAKTGRELARSPLIPAIVSGIMLEPGYAGRLYSLSEHGKIIELTVQPAR